MDLPINIDECIFIENLLDQHIEDVIDSIDETKEEMNEQDENSEQYIRNLQFTFEYEEKIEEAYKIKNKRCMDNLNNCWFRIPTSTELDLSVQHFLSDITRSYFC